MPETEVEKRETYGEHLVKCIAEFCSAREKVFINAISGKSYGDEICEVTNKGTELAKAIDEIIMEFHYPYN